jgi:uncharacterized protein
VEGFTLADPHSQINDENTRASTLFDEGKYTEALQKYRELAEGGSLGAQLRIGWMYHKGKGVKQDLEHARWWYHKAAESGDPAGQFYLGTLHKTKKEYEQAVDWFEKAAAQAYLPALYTLGKMFEYGTGVPKDRMKATSYFTKAAQSGHVPSQGRIALRMIKGDQGILQIPRGLWRMVRVLWAANRLLSEDPYDERVLW